MLWGEQAQLLLRKAHDLLHDAGISLPEAVRELVAWSPFAVAYRYDDWPITDPVDRDRAHELTRAAIAWVERELPLP